MPQDGKAFALMIELVRDDAVLSELIVQLPPTGELRPPPTGQLRLSPAEQPPELAPAEDGA